MMKLRLVKASTLLVTHNATIADIVVALDLGVRACEEATGRMVVRLEDVNALPDCELKLLDDIASCGPFCREEHEMELTKLRLHYVQIDLNAFESVTGLKPVVSSTTRKVGMHNTAAALSAKADKTAAAYCRDIEVAVALAAECALDGNPCSTPYHESRWNQLLKKNGIRGARKKSFEAFRRGLPAHLKEANPGEAKKPSEAE